MDGQAVLRRLMEGNGRFVRGERAPHDFGRRRLELLAGQHPVATVLTCSDSRVVPEYIFDVDLGELFDIETAGNVLDEVGLGTIEYGVEHLGTPLLLVLAHTRCGAVTACCRSGSAAPGHLGAVLSKLEGAVERAHHEVDEAIRANALQVRDSLPRESEVVGRRVGEGKLLVVAALYRLETGEVELL